MIERRARRSRSATRCSTTASRSSTPARSPAPAPPATWSIREGYDSLGDGRRDRRGPARQGLGPDADLAAVLSGRRRRYAAGDRDSEVHHQPGEGGRAQTMKWTDVTDIAIELAETHPGRRSDARQFRRPDELGDGAARLQRRPQALRREGARSDPARPGSTRSTDALVSRGPPGADRYPLPPGRRRVRRRPRRGGGAGQRGRRRHHRCAVGRTRQLRRRRRCLP